MSTPDFGHSAWAEQRRMEKAVALETALSVEGIGADAARTLPPRARRRIEHKAGVNRSSDETWGKAIALLADYEQTRARLREEHR